MVSTQKLLGKTVITKKGTVLGKVADIELDDKNWTPETLDVELSDDVAKTYGVKSGPMKKSVVPLPFKIIGSISDTVMLSEEITNVNDLRNHVTTTGVMSRL